MNNPNQLSFGNLLDNLQGVVVILGKAKHDYEDYAKSFGSQLLYVPKRI